MRSIIGELYAFCSGWTAAAVRLRLVNHRTAQVVLHRIRGVIAEAAFDAADGDITRIASCTPMLDLMSMRHEDAELRLFAT
jgi:urease accessory protein